MSLRSPLYSSEAQDPDELAVRRRQDGEGMVMVILPITGECVSCDSHFLGPVFSSVE
jgi:hypothetical protein